MNEKLQEALAEIIQLTLQGKDFVLEQAPGVITQLLRWEYTISLIWFCVGVLILAFAIWFIVYSVKADVIDYDAIFHCGCAAFLIGLFMIGCNIDWLQIAIAPKAYLLEYASELIK